MLQVGSSPVQTRLFTISIAAGYPRRNETFLHCGILSSLEANKRFLWEKDIIFARKPSYVDMQILEEPLTQDLNKVLFSSSCYRDLLVEKVPSSSILLHSTSAILCSLLLRTYDCIHSVFTFTRFSFWWITLEIETLVLNYKIQIRVFLNMLTCFYTNKNRRELEKNLRCMLKNIMVLISMKIAYVIHACFAS